MSEHSKIKVLLMHPRYMFLFLLHRCSHLIKNDKFYYRCQYRLITGKKLNIENPVTYCEKIQWLKLYDRKPVYTTMVDKLAVKEFVANRIGKEYVVPLLGVWDKPEDIDYSSLPNQFVLKATHGGGGLDVVICSDKTKLDFASVNFKLKRSLKKDYWRMREWPYKDVPRKIIAEAYLEDESGELIDYKVMCFNGKAELIQVHRNRFTHQTQDIYDTSWNKVKIFQSGYPYTEDRIDKPIQLEEMITLSERLSIKIPQVRVDWYIVNNQLFFGELTFFDSAGFAQWQPKEWERRLGDLIVLPEKNQL